MTAAWSPWGALRERPHIDLHFANLPPGFAGLYGRRGDQAVILLGKHLRRTARRCTLAHELVHDEWGAEPVDVDAMPPAWLAVSRREEERVELEVSRRLVPSDELRHFAAVLVELGYGVEAIDVAERFDVTKEVAERALRAVGAG